MKCVFNRNLPCVNPMLSKHCEDDIKMLRTLKEFGMNDVIDKVSKEMMQKIHYISGVISPAYHCPLYPKKLEVSLVEDDP